MPEEQQAQLSDWLVSGMPYQEAKARVEKDFNVTTSLGALAHFYKTYSVSALLRRRTRAVATADEIARVAAGSPGKFDAATIDALKQQAFELAISPGADPKNVKALFSLVLKARDQDNAEQELKLARERFEFDAAKAALAHLPALRKIAGDKTLDASGRLLAIRRQLFGVVPE